MFRIEDEEEENFFKEEPEASIENAKKLATGQHFEYINVASIKKEPDHVFKGEPGDSSDFEGIKEEVVDDIFVQDNDACHGDIETHGLHDEPVKQEDLPRHRNDLPASCSESTTELHKCKACSKSSKHLSCLRCNSEVQPRGYVL